MRAAVVPARCVCVGLQWAKVIMIDNCATCKERCALRGANVITNKFWRLTRLMKKKRRKTPAPHRRETRRPSVGRRRLICNANSVNQLAAARPCGSIRAKEVEQRRKQRSSDQRCGRPQLLLLLLLSGWHESHEIGQPSNNKLQVGVFPFGRLKRIMLISSGATAAH